MKFKSILLLNYNYILTCQAHCVMNRLKMTAVFTASLQVLLSGANAAIGGSSKYTHILLTGISETPVREPKSFPDAEEWQSMVIVPMAITVSEDS